MRLSTRIVRGKVVTLPAGEQLRKRPRGNAFEPTRQRILERDSFRCQIGLDVCTGRATCVDHIVPRARGGDDSDSNLRAACAPCNLKRGAGG